MTTLSLSLPQVGSLDSIEEPKIPSDFTAIQNWANGNIDSDNLTAATSQAAGINTAGTKVKGTVFNAGPGTRTNTAYGALGDAADQVTGITLATNGLLRVWFFANWSATVANGGFAAIFVGANQLKGAPGLSSGNPVVQEANIPNIAGPAILYSASGGLVSPNTVASYGGDVTTGQLIGAAALSTGGGTDIFAAAGTYTVAVNYKASSGTVTASGRHLWVQAISFG